jgi:hypothetical protein
MSEEKEDGTLGSDIERVKKWLAIDVVLLRRVITFSIILGGFVGGTIRGCSEEFRQTEPAGNAGAGSTEILAQGQEENRRGVEYNENAIRAHGDVAGRRDKAATLQFQSINKREKEQDRRIEIMRGRLGGMDDNLESVIARLPPR